MIKSLSALSQNKNQSRFLQRFQNFNGKLSAILMIIMSAMFDGKARLRECQRDPFKVNAQCPAKFDPMAHIPRLRLRETSAALNLPGETSAVPLRIKSAEENCHFRQSHKAPICFASSVIDSLSNLHAVTKPQRAPFPLPWAFSSLKLYALNVRVFIFLVSYLFIAFSRQNQRIYFPLTKSI